VTLLRNPLKHVLSQFLHCRYTKFKDFAIAKQHGFPGYDDLEHPLVGLSEWLKTFTEADLHDKAKPMFDYGCYNPWNMQARYLATTHSHHVVTRLAEPDAQAAKFGLQNLTYVGIVDLYPETICGYQFYVSGALPPDCECVNSVEKGAQLQHIAYRSPDHSVDQLTSDQLKLTSRLVHIDVQLFAHGLALFERQLDFIFRMTGKRIVCGNRLADLKHEARGLCSTVGIAASLCAIP